MNTIGVILSAAALVIALVELRLRYDLAGRRMCAMLTTCSWLTMASVAWDCHRQCQAMYDQMTPAISKQESRDIEVPRRAKDDDQLARAD